MPDPITLFQAWIANWAVDILTLLPVSYAFGAGMVSTVNPCGFALLPAYLSLYLGAREEDFAQRSAFDRAAKALDIGAMVTLGFILLFGGVGLIIAVGGQFLVRVFPWLGLLTGVVMAILGVLLLGGKHLYSGLLAHLAAHIETPRRGGLRAYLVFGIAYGMASLCCTLPVFLVVVGSSIAVQGVIAGLFQFISYALGMGVVLIIFTLGMALFKRATVGSFRALVPYVERVSAGLMLLMGLYLVYYWLTKGGLLGSFS